ncbi:MAG: M1 family metallopeptidase [Cyanobacteria bacterium J06635_15]
MMKLTQKFYLTVIAFAVGFILAIALWSSHIPQLVLVQPHGKALATESLDTDVSLASKSLPTPDWDNVSLHSLGMQPQFADDIDQFVDRIQYQIAAELTFDPDAVIQGSQRVRYTNPSRQPLDRIVFRLYANTPPLRNAGEMFVSNVRVDGQPITTQLSVEDTVLSVPLAQPLEPGQSVVIYLDFSLRLRQHEISESFERLGFIDRVVSAGSWYPAVSVYEAQRGWWVTPITSGRGDPTYGEMALYEVFLTLPEDVTLITNGGLVGQTVLPDGRITYHDITGPVRSHVFIASDRYAMTEMREVNGVRVQVWSYQDDETLTPDLDQAVLQTTVDALSTFGDQFIPYPYREFDVVQHPTYTGLEFSGLTIITAAGWRQGEVAQIIAHEVGHQWFYGLVGNNQVEHPWLDEALATYSEVVYERAIDHQQASEWAEELQVIWESLNRPNRVADRSLLPPLNLPVAAYEDGQYSIVYWAGAAFFIGLEQQLGQDGIYQSLQEYCQRFRYEVATTADLKSVLEAVSGQDLTALFERWVGDYSQDDQPARAV